MGGAERRGQEEERQQGRMGMALAGLLAATPGPALAVRRRALVALAPANQRRLLQHWLGRQGLNNLPAQQIDVLLGRMASGRGPGSSDLREGLRLQWDRQHLWLHQANAHRPARAEPPDSP